MSMQLTADAFGVNVGNPIGKLILLKLCDVANADGTSCFPSHKHIADICEVSKRTVIRRIRELEEKGFLTVHRRTINGKKTSNIYLIHLLGKCGKNHTGGDIESLSSDTMSPLSSDTQSHKPVTLINQSNKYTGKITFSEWMIEISESGGIAISHDDCIFEWAEMAGMPEEFIHIAWNEFKGRYSEENKKYEGTKGWRQVFRKSVKGIWLELWYIDKGTGDLVLTSAGLIAQNVMNRGEK